MAGQKKEQGDKSDTGSAPEIHWNDETMQTGYANICNVAGTREEVSLFFGTNESWQAGKKPVEVRLNHRILMTPHTAKRMQLLLENTLKQYESRYGEIELETVGATVAAHSGAAAGNGSAKN